jgi:glycosyltransferase involved in cell wall biosynthesis
MMTPAPGASRPLRVLMVVPTYYPAVRYGGTIRCVHGLAAALVRRGHEVHVYTTSIDGESDLTVPLGTAVEIDGVAVHYFRVPFLRRLFWTPTLRARVQATAADFDIIHLHSVYLFPTWVAARAAFRSGVPYVVTPHGMLIRDVIRRKRPWVKTTWINLIERKTFRRAAGIHVTAHVERTELSALRLATPEAVTQIPHGLDLPEQHLSRAHTPFASLPSNYGLFLGRICWTKGLDRLLTAWARVPDLPLVIAGNDDECYTPALRALAGSLGLAPRVIFTGAVSDEHKWALYQGARLFVLPSYSENFGLVAAEAMAMGCPVVVTPEAGIAELIRAERAGVVSSNEPNELAAALTALMADDAQRRALGQRGGEVVRQHLGWTQVVQQIESFYLSARARSVVAKAA